MSAGRNRTYQGPPSDHFDGERFFNPGHPSTDRGMGDMLRWRFGERRAKWAATQSKQAVPAARVAELTMTLVGHASFLLQVDGRNILVDPVWSTRASPFRWAGPRRYNEPGIRFEALPPIDVVLVTHNHYDHLDVRTLGRLWKAGRPQIVAPLGNDRTIARADPDITVRTLDWGEHCEVCPGLSVWLHPAHHWSSRGLFDRRIALWGGFVIKTDTASIFVAGDTGYSDGAIFRAVRERHGPPDLAILPIGAYAPRWFLTDQHVNPAEAVQIMQDCGAVQALGVHWGTFALTDEPQWAPERDLRDALEEAGIAADRFLAMQPGDTWTRRA